MYGSENKKDQQQRQSWKDQTMSHQYTRDSFAMAKERFSSQLDNLGAAKGKLGRKGGSAADRKRKRNRETSSESDGVTPGTNKILKD